MGSGKGSHMNEIDGVDLVVVPIRRDVELDIDVNLGEDKSENIARDG